MEGGKTAMKARSLIAFAGVAVLFIFCFSANAQHESYQFPRAINYQGLLTDNNGYPITDTLAMTFNIYETEGDVAPEWTETQDSVEVLHGVFSVTLGSVVPIDVDVFENLYRWLGIQVESDPEMTPRELLTATPYAYRTAYAGILYYIPATPRDSAVVDIPIPHHGTFQVMMSELGGTSDHSAWVTGGENDNQVSYVGIDGYGNVVSGTAQLYQTDTLLTVHPGLILRTKGDNSRNLVLDSENYSYESKAVLITPYLGTW